MTIDTGDGIEATRPQARQLQLIIVLDLNQGTLKSGTAVCIAQIRRAKMEQSISGHVVRLFPASNSAIVLLDDAQEIAVTPDCLPAGAFDQLHIGDRVWYYPGPGERPHDKHSGRVVPIHARYGADYLKEGWESPYAVCSDVRFDIAAIR
jgi:hypothetical protein